MKKEKIEEEDKVQGTTNLKHQKDNVILSNPGKPRGLLKCGIEQTAVI